MLEIEKILLKSCIGYDAWEQYKKGDLPNSLLQPFAEQIKKLSAIYVERSTSHTEVINNELARAYALYFTPINYEKILRLLPHTGIQKSNKSVKILDYGCGPATGTLACLNYFEQQLEATLFDSSKPMLNLAEKILKESKEDQRLNFKCSSKLNERYDLIIAANVFSELNKEAGQELITLFYNSLNEDGTIMLVDTAISSYTKELMKLRDFTLSNFADLKVIFPCTHSKSCPMLENSTDDWCHAQMSWERPRLIKQLDDLTGFNKHRIKYSSFIFKKAASNLNAYRCVSFQEKGKTGNKIKVCGKDYFGDLTLRKKERSESNHIFIRADLYDLLEISEKTDDQLKKDTKVKLILAP